MEEFEVSDKELNRLRKRLDKRKKLHKNLVVQTALYDLFKVKMERLREERRELLEEVRDLWVYGNEGL